MALWGRKDTIINEAELHAAPILATSAQHYLEGSDILWFIDNQAAETALVKAGSPAESMCAIALVATACLARIRARPWYEHIASEDNPSDVLSRAGESDPAVAHKIHSGQWVRLPVVEPDWSQGLNYPHWWGQDEQ